MSFLKWESNDQNNYRRTYLLASELKNQYVYLWGSWTRFHPDGASESSKVVDFSFDSSETCRCAIRRRDAAPNNDREPRRERSPIRPDRVALESRGDIPSENGDSRIKLTFLRVDGKMSKSLELYYPGTCVDLDGYEKCCVIIHVSPDNFKDTCVDRVMIELYNDHNFEIRLKCATMVTGPPQLPDTLRMMLWSSTRIVV
ncbi:hypothetical protein CRV170 [Nile crocodilepox virus]|uniref:Uncharacterized protein n=1 Tax=Nile crocodilepox virus (isolate Crocodylus niloticus/Zimbabwe/Ume/2001) TaxID=1289473 RepID=Q06ZY1_CPRVZ|nr:hypothetical protein CRV170 [Nile crocodilepox virus]ABJ09061.1 hypothetical protein CRV170 [Nile crocodilepox virus]